jgi:hypothetical protein
MVTWNKSDRNPPGAFLVRDVTVATVESLSFALYVKRQTPGKEQFYCIRQ